jgi:hypothetical protein
MTVKGGNPISRRHKSAAMMMPKTVFGWSGFALSATISGCDASNPPVLAST